jgi:calcineurin-like phosphoesterase family protein
MANDRKTWFTADTHFGHSNIIRYCDRTQFISPEALAEWKTYPRGTTPSAALLERIEIATVKMDREMIERWNATVAEEDDVWHLGDFCSTRRMLATDYLRRLNGRKHLIRGNHDPESTYGASEWVFNRSFAELRCEKTNLTLCHYAMRVWNDSYKGKAYQLFGHSHGMLEPQAGQCDVGVDCWNFTPVSLDQIKARIIPFPDHDSEKN